MTLLEQLKQLIDEANYPYFEGTYLQARIDELGTEQNLYPLARELCMLKAGIEEIKLGDVVIPSPRRHFLALAARYRKNLTGTVVRADGQ